MGREFRRQSGGGNPAAAGHHADGESSAAHHAVPDGLAAGADGDPYTHDANSNPYAAGADGDPYANGDPHASCADGHQDTVLKPLRRTGCPSQAF